ncbi:large multi-functional protein [Haloferula helveola]|uniref:Large multi-functional protein n=1 Tax=Haloferula helveola TaxID=490095 RepID=A0ABM7RI17_9BACT|nr:large multi-functional protein [Haloferula helveola]
MKTTLLILLASGLPALAASDYRIENIPIPGGIPPEVGGIDIASDGSLFVVLRRGDVFKTTPKPDSTDFEWKLFATGFHNGCGIDAVTPDKIRVSQMAEFTEAEDTDGDGTADRYRAFASGWGLSGNYHETNALAEDGKGGYYLAIGTASFNGPTFEHTLADYSKAGRRGRNFSGVKWRGWVLHCDSEGKLTPFASGFRMHNGIHVDANGDVWCGDNQGDWKATTPLYHVEKGNFYGHPSSLVWDPKWEGKDPLAFYRDDMDAYNRDRTHPAVQVPYGEVNRSASEPMVIPDNFPHFPGQMLLLDNNGRRITRIMLEKVDGEYQGACTHFIDGQGLRSGNNRVRFTPDGKQLYVGQTVRGWGKLAEGLQRITPVSEETPFDIDRVSIRPDGFEVSFTESPESSGDGVKVESFRYQSKWTYGAPQMDKRKHEASVAGADGKLVIKVADFDPGRVYSIELPKIKSKDGEEIRNRVAYYTANRIPKSE